MHVQYFATIGQLSNKSYVKDISWYLSLRWVKDTYDGLQ